MSLRVIAGSAKGMKLKSVPGDSTRPIMDRVKEALFSIIGQDILDATLLDLFGGTGSVGIEALSRGAEHVTFVDMNRKAINTIYQNLDNTKLKKQAQVIQRNAFDVIEQSPTKLYHYIYVAPPQYKEIWVKVLQLLDDNPNWHNHDTIIIVQIDPREYDTTIQFKNLIEYDQRKYGQTMLLFYEFVQEDDVTNLSQESELE